MLQQTIKAYQETKLAILNKVIESSEIVDEDGFLDDGFIGTKIASFKKEYASIQTEISILTEIDDPRNLQTIINYRARQEDLVFQMAFYASNSLRNIEFCLELTKDMNIDFSLCLHALKAYKDDSHLESFRLFHKYFSNKQGVLEHYLINKIYGKLLLQENQLLQAKTLLQKAVEKRPEDIELHQYLKEIYTQLGYKIECQIETMIINQLKGIGKLMSAPS